MAAGRLFLLSCSLAVVLQSVYSQDLRWLSLQLERIKHHDVNYLKDEISQSVSRDEDVRIELEEALLDLWTEDVIEEWPKLLDKLSRGCVESTISLVSNSSTSILSKVLPLLDASGKPGAGMLNGNFIYDGAYDECYTYKYTAFCYATGLTLVNHTLYPQWVLGLCVPKHCTGEDLSYLVNLTGRFQVSDQTVYCEDVKEPPYSSGAIVMLVVTALFVAMVCSGTVVDIIIKYLPLFLTKNGGSLPVNTGVGRDGERKPLLPKLGMPRIKDSVMPWDFLTAFSLLRTVPTLLATKQAASVITSLNGLRVISMFWVILGHTYFWILTPGHVDNPIIMKNVLSRFSFQAVGNAFFSVDSFFFLSGVLVAYLSLREMEKKHGRFPILHYYIHRYLRLTPVYAFILFFAWTLFGHLATGPGFIAGAHVQSTYCQKYWWTNFLYINNFYPWKSAEGSCIGWTWYLANDMQFYIISPLILIPMYFLFPVALVIILVLLIISITVTFALTGVYDFQANLFAPIAYNYTMNTSSPQYFDLVYQKPWSRIQPYLVGLLLGYLLHKKFRFRFGMKGNVCAYLLLWVAAGVVMIPDLYGLYFTFHGHVPGKAENVLYIGLSRFAWGLGLALIVFACHNGYGWFINSFLSMNIWTPLARMTYNAYLVHPLVLSVVYGQLQKAFHYTDITISVFAVSFVMISYGIAALVCVVVEFPLATIESLVFKLVGVRGRESLRQGTLVEAGDKDDNTLQASGSLFSKTVA